MPVDWLTLLFDRLDEDLDRAAAGQPDIPGHLVGDAVAQQFRLAGADDLLGLSKTADSTQPPLTEPARSPPFETASVAPTGRGAEPSTLTTVASATLLPAARQASIWGKSSFMGYLYAGIGNGLSERTGGLSAISLKSCASASRLLRLWMGRKSSTYGRAARMPWVSG